LELPSRARDKQVDIFLLGSDETERIRQERGLPVAQGADVHTSIERHKRGIALGVSFSPDVDVRARAVLLPIVAGTAVVEGMTGFLQAQNRELNRGWLKGGLVWRLGATVGTAGIFGLAADQIGPVGNLFFLGMGGVGAFLLHRSHRDAVDVLDSMPQQQELAAEAAQRIGERVAYDVGQTFGGGAVNQPGYGHA
jgi:hypothetical protein